jgi:hypothetical protein
LTLSGENMPSMIRVYAGWLLLVSCFASVAEAQQAPSIGYMFPPGGQAGSTVDVVLGGYDWTPDMELFVRHAQIQLEVAGAPGPVIVPEPPYWFGKKARRGPFMLPRETPAKLKLPTNLTPGVYRWQAANANGVTASGKFAVSNGLEVIENPDRPEPQLLPSLPVTVSGQILKIEEVDEFRFTALSAGPMTCEIIAAAIGSPLAAVVEIRDASGQLIADAADTAARDVKFTFAVEAGQEYTARVYDVDFRGNRSFVYRLSLTPGPSLVTTIPAFVQRGSTQDVEFIGYGLKTGAARLESITRKIQVPADAQTVLRGDIEASDGTKLPYEIPTSDIPEIVEQQPGNEPAKSIQELDTPGAVTGVLSQRYGIDRYRALGAKGDVWSIDLLAEAIGSPLDVSLAIVNEAGVELKRVDDFVGTTDAQIEFKLPADGAYDLIVGDTSGMSGRLTSVYRLVVGDAAAGFRLSIPETLPVPINGSAVLSVKAERFGDFTGPIAIAIDGLPAGVSVPEGSVIPEKKNDLKLTISASADAGTIARMIALTGSALITEKPVTHSPEPTLLAVTMKPPFSIDAEGKNDVTKWPRGTTYPAPVLVERDEAFKGDIVLEMAARQGRHRQGIRGPEMTITPDQNRILYPVFLPEWLETTRTSRMVVNGVTKIADPTGRVRYLSSKLVTRLGFLPTGAMLKIESAVRVLELSSAGAFEFPVTILRSAELTGPVVVELIHETDATKAFSATAVKVDENTGHVVLRVTPAAGHVVSRATQLKARATGTWNGHPVIAETELTVVPVSVSPRKVAVP